MYVARLNWEDARQKITSKNQSMDQVVKIVPFTQNNRNNNQNMEVHNPWINPPQSMPNYRPPMSYQPPIQQPQVCKMFTSK